MCSDAHTRVNSSKLYNINNTNLLMYANRWHCHAQLVYEMTPAMNFLLHDPHNVFNQTRFFSITCSYIWDQAKLIKADGMRIVYWYSSLI